MTVAVKKWGNSLAVRIPKDIAMTLAVNENSLVELEIVRDGLLLKPQKSTRLEELVAGITDENLHHEVSTGKSVGQ